MARKKNYIDNANVSVDVKFSDITSDDYKNLNPRFTVKKTSIMTYEQIANMFKFSKDLILSKFNQLDMLPIVGYFEDGEPTSHDSKAVPYGAVLPKTARFEMIEGEDYLVADSCLWSGRYNVVSDVSNFNESMEIVGVKALFNKDEKYYDVSDFTFDCLTMLNKDVNPAFKKARMDVDANFSDDFEAFKAEFTEMLQDIKTQENGSEQMENAKTEFTLVDLERLWGLIYGKLEEKYPDINGYGSIYRIDGIYEDTSNNAKFALLRKRDTDELFKVDFTFDDNGLTLADEAMLVVEAIVETGEVSKFEEPENIAQFKEFVKVEPEQTEPHMEDNTEPEPEPTNYEQLYNELQAKFNELVAKCSEFETEIVPLRQFKAEVEEKENQAKIEMELKEKNDLVESFATKLPKKSIDDIIDDVSKFTLDEIKTKLSVALADQILANNEKKEEFSDITLNIDDMNKTVSREDRLIEEVKSKKKKLN